MTKENEPAVERRQPSFSELDPWKRWHPYQNLMDPFPFSWPFHWSKPAAPAPRVDITECDNEYRVRVELAGVTRDDVTVELERGVLTIRGEKRSQREKERERSRQLECCYGAFSRSLPLPRDADADRVSAEFRDGVLHIAIQKGAARKPKRIPVEG